MEPIELEINFILVCLGSYEATEYKNNDDGRKQYLNVELLALEENFKRTFRAYNIGMKKESLEDNLKLRRKKELKLGKSIILFSYFITNLIICLFVLLQPQPHQQQ